MARHACATPNSGASDVGEGCQENAGTSQTQSTRSSYRLPHGSRGGSRRGRATQLDSMGPAILYAVAKCRKAAEGLIDAIDALST
jgi:hypothetical protein